MENYVEVRATFQSCNVKSGKTVMQLELSPEHRHALSSLAMLVGTQLSVRLTSDQQILFVDRDTGEVTDDQAVLELPGEVADDFEDDDSFQW